MKYNTIKKGIVSKIALIVLATITSYTYTSHNEEKIGGLNSAFTSVESNLFQFVDMGNKTSFNTYIINLITTLQNLQRVVETTVRSHNDEVSKEVDELLDYALQQFTILVDIFKKYNGKPAETHAVSFGDEIKREFDVEKIFAEMLTKLKSIRGKAHQAGEKHLVKDIEKLAANIQQKKKVWDGKIKNKLALLGGLFHRMRC